MSLSRVLLPLAIRPMVFLSSACVKGAPLISEAGRATGVSGSAVTCRAFQWTCSRKSAKSSARLSVPAAAPDAVRGL
eukprot:4532753-Pyramimonas_sp.AAC.1